MGRWNNKNNELSNVIKKIKKVHIVDIYNYLDNRL